jgi:hypothetical protein
MSTIAHQTVRAAVLGLGAVFVLGFVACLDYDLNSWDSDEPPTPDPPELGDDDDTVEDEEQWEVVPLDDDPGVIIEEVPSDDDDDFEEPDELPDCDETIEADWQWWGSMPFGHEEDPTDGNGLPYYDPNYTMVDYSTVSMPDQGHITSGYDKVYRAEFQVDTMPPALFLSMQSDDGLAFYLNGQLVGEWGGMWQEEGCVNDNAGCTESISVSPVDVTAYLQYGRNVASARVSNPVDNSYFEVYTECVE